MSTYNHLHRCYCTVPCIQVYFFRAVRRYFGSAVIPVCCYTKVVLFVCLFVGSFCVTSHACVDIGEAKSLHFRCYLYLQVEESQCLKKITSYLVWNSSWLTTTGIDRPRPFDIILCGCAISGPSRYCFETVLAKHDRVREARHSIQINWYKKWNHAPEAPTSCVSIDCRARICNPDVLRPIDQRYRVMVISTTCNE